MKRLTPLKSIRAKCAWCCGNQPLEVKHCPATSCPLHPWRMGRKPEGAMKSALKTVREKCLMDCGETNSAAGVKDCQVKDCPLWEHRLGKRPVSEEFREKMRGLALARGASLPLKREIQAVSAPQGA